MIYSLYPLLKVVSGISLHPGSWGAAYKTALLAFKKFKLQKYPSYTDSEAKDAAKAFRKLIEQNA